MSEVTTAEVAPADAGIRLDRWFRRHYPQLSHGRLEKLLRTGQVRIDGARAKASARLEAGQAIRIPPLGDAEAAPAPARKAPAPDRRAADALRRAVLHRDDDVIALDKPPGLATQGGTKVAESVDSLLDALRFGAAERPRLVHRLDKDTSGVLLLGRSAAAASRLAAAFRGRDAVKTYWALVAGVPRPARGRIALDLAKRRPAGGRERAVAVEDDDEDALRAVTEYAVVEAAARRCAWLDLRPRTGRTHQLRVHCAEGLGTPILGDGKYGGRAAFLPGVPGGKRLHLHARAIALPHPAGGMLRVTAPLPPALAATWAFFGFDSAAAPDPFA